MKLWNVRAALSRQKDEWKFEQYKRCSNGCFLHVVLVYRNLMISPNEVDGREYRAVPNW